MNLGSGILIFMGFLLLLIGIASKIMGMSLLAPFISSYLGYFIGANSCILLALAIDKFQQ